MSGLFHEWLLYIVFHIHEKDKDENGYCESCFYPSMYGGQMMFFFWCGFTVAVEVFVIKYFPVVNQMTKRLPTFVLTIMTLMSSLPFAHLFFGEMVAANYFNDCHMSIPIFVLMNDNTY